MFNLCDQGSNFFRIKGARRHVVVNPIWILDRNKYDIAVLDDGSGWLRRVKKYLENWWAREKGPCQYLTSSYLGDTRLGIQFRSRRCGGRGPGPNSSR